MIDSCVPTPAPEFVTFTLLPHSFVQLRALRGLQMIATACLFLAGKVEETPKPLKEVVRVSYLVQHKQEYERAFRHIQQKVINVFLKRLLLSGLASSLNPYLFNSYRFA